MAAKKIKTFDVLITENTEDLKVLISYINKQCIWFKLMDVKKGDSKKFYFYINQDNQKCFYDICGNKYFTVAQGNFIYFINFSNPENISKHAIGYSRTFTCVTCHPTEEIVLTGDNTGRAVIWQNIFEKDKVQAVYHWHTLPLRAACFSTAGSYFYTGGEECVLVKWQLDNPNEKKFLPRLAAEIEHISVATNNLYLALATKDNAIRIIDNKMDQVNIINYLMLGNQYRSGIVYDPRTKALIMNGYHGHVQFYIPQDMSLLYSIDIVGQNRITNERDCIIENTEVTKVAVNKTGMWLATVEERKDTTYHNEIRLKFWKFNSESQKFELNTSVEYPHEKSIKNILFQPVNKEDTLRCVTLADDKKFKIWQLVDATTVYKKGVAWNCLGVGFFRDLSCCGLSFSVDGSLMAIGFGTILTTWTPDSCELKCTLFHPIHKEKIAHVNFGYSNQCHLLVSASSQQLSVWNLLTLCMIWTVPIRVECLIADPVSTHMAVLTMDRKVFVFTPNSPVPLFSNTSLLSKQKVVAALFVPSQYSNDASLKWYERSHLYFINSENELYCISSNEIDLNVTDETFDKEKSVFSMMNPQHSVNLVHTEAKTHLFKRDTNEKTFKKFLEAPIQTMAPVRFTCYSLLKSLVVQKDNVN